MAECPDATVDVSQYQAKRDLLCDFLASVVRQWEDAAESARSAGVRVVHPRFGVVLSRQGGALEKLLPAFRMGVGGRMGDGRQWMSWVSLDDAAGAIEHGLMTAGLQGPVNVTAPEPATNADFLPLQVGR